MTQSGDPVRAPEWRQILQIFDAKWAASVSNTSPPQQLVESTVESQADHQGAGEDAPLVDSSFDWGDVFADEPRTKAELESKYGAGCHSFSVSNNVTGMLIEGPKLFVIASADAEIDLQEPVICFGAGTWLLDAKATSFQEDPANIHKSYTYSMLNVHK